MAAEEVTKVSNEAPATATTAVATQAEPDGPSEELLAELAEANERLEQAPAGEAIAWTAGRFGPDVVVASSFQDSVLIDLAVKAVPGIEVLFLDTKFHFDETLAYVETCREFFAPLNLSVLVPGPEAAPWPCGSERCCETRKVLPLEQHLAGRQAWVTGLKRVDTPERADAPVIGWDYARKLVKVNPLAAWTDDDIDAYAAEQGLPVHPLMEKGYRSIGCAPTTRPTADGEDPRAGRWSGTGKTECGLHV
jgi:phosphoadenosine phosphosulfate reductase